MIIRIVKMTFRPECVEEFLKIFNHYKSDIAKQEGCCRLELLNDIDNPNIFMTYSWWDSQKFLDNYRGSQTFGLVWPATKKLFLEKPEAWSVKRLAKID